MNKPSLCHFHSCRFLFLLSLLLSTSTAFAGKTVHVYNWDGYIGKDTVKHFEKDTGIKVVYDVFDSWETVEAKLLSGSSGYDVVNMSSYYMSRQIPTGVWVELDKSKIPNWKNINPAVLTPIAEFDPGNKFSQPYSWYTEGIAYNKAEIAKRFPKTPDSWSMVLEVENVKKLSECGFTWVDASSDLFFPALVYYGLDPYSTNPKDYETVLAKAIPIRPYIRNFTNEYYNDLAGGETCASISWSGDTASMEGSVKKGVELIFFLPKEGSYIDYDTMAIPSDAPNKEEAYAFLNYILQPNEAADFTNTAKYPNSVTAALPLVEKRLLTEHIVFYPTDDQKKRLFVSKKMPVSIDRLQTRLWTKFKTSI